MDMNPGSGALLGFSLTAGGLSALAESHGNPWWLWIIVFVVLAAFVGFMLWWWLHDTGEEEVTEPARHAEAPPPIPTPPAVAVDDLKRIEGIGPRIAGVLQEAGITTFRQLSNTPAEQLGEILGAEDPRLLRLADPATWPQQAALAAAGNWSALEELQDELKGGRKV
jgi:predicted flap endonuclease-1-like 5' DNA nuclease